MKFKVLNSYHFGYLRKIIKFSSFSIRNSCHIPYNAELDYEYLCAKSNRHDIKENLFRRKVDGDIDKIYTLWETLKTKDLSNEDKTRLRSELQLEALKIPNISSPHLCEYGDTPHLLGTFNEKPSFDFKPKEFHKLVQDLKLLRIDKHLSYMTGSRSYVLCGALADLERALIQYSISVLRKKGFCLISVPDLLYSHIIERMGMHTRGERSQVYHLSNFAPKEVCLSGTAEMALGGYMQDRTLDINILPLKLAAVSRCYRKELSGTAAEKGIFRVHQFNKVEMFGVTANETGRESEQLYQELVGIQTEIFAHLGFHFQVLDMPIMELGNPAYTKTDIEAWIPVRHYYGEISSTSNCLDYQSRRLNLKYKNSKGETKHAHTVNGTACAVPRVLISMVASQQEHDSSIRVPEVLQPYMNGCTTISRSMKPRLEMTHFHERSYSRTIVKPEDLE